MIQLWIRANAVTKKQMNEIAGAFLINRIRFVRLLGDTFDKEEAEELFFSILKDEGKTPWKCYMITHFMTDPDAISMRKAASIIKGPMAEHFRMFIALKYGEVG